MGRDKGVHPHWQRAFHPYNLSDMNERDYMPTRMSAGVGDHPSVDLCFLIFYNYDSY